MALFNFTDHESNGLLPTGGLPGSRTPTTSGSERWSNLMHPDTRTLAGEEPGRARPLGLRRLPPGHRPNRSGKGDLQ